MGRSIHTRLSKSEIHCAGKECSSGESVNCQANSHTTTFTGDLWSVMSVLIHSRSPEAPDFGNEGRKL